MRAHLNTPRFRRAAVAAAALAVAASLVSACGSSSSSASHSGSGPAKDTTADLVRAADVSTKVAGFKTVISVQEDLPSMGTLTMSGSGSFQEEPSRVGSLTLDMSIPGAAAAAEGLGNLQMSMVLDGTTMYLKMPAALASKLPGGKPWFELNLAQLGKAGSSSGLSSLMSSGSQMSDPGQYFTYLKAVSSGSLQERGTATINGVQTTHYHADVDLSKLVTLVPAAQQAGVQQSLAQMQKAHVATTIPLDVWIDSSNLVRRIALDETVAVSGKSTTVKVQEDFPEYGPQPAPSIPSASDVTNLSALLSSGL